MSLSSRESPVGASWLIALPTNTIAKNFENIRAVTLFFTFQLIQLQCFPFHTTLWYQLTLEDSFSSTTTQKNKHFPTSMLNHEVFPSTHSFSTFQTRWCPISNQVLFTTIENNGWINLCTISKLVSPWLHQNKQEEEKWKFNKCIPSPWLYASSYSQWIKIVPLLPSPPPPHSYPSSHVRS